MMKSIVTICTCKYLF